MSSSASRPILSLEKTPLPQPPSEDKTNRTARNSTPSSAPRLCLGQSPRFTSHGELIRWRAALYGRCFVCVYMCTGPESSPRSVWMNKADFDASIRELVPARWIPEGDKQRLSHVCVCAREREGSFFFFAFFLLCYRFGFCFV